MNIHINFRIQSRLEGIEVVNKLRGKISHACNSMIRILTTAQNNYMVKRGTWGFTVLRYLTFFMRYIGNFNFNVRYCGII